AAASIYFVAGDGTFDADTGGSSYGDSYVKINPGGAVVDSFTPHDQANLNASHFDRGAAGPLPLPEQPGPLPRLLVSAGKNNTIYLLNRDNMGGHNPDNDN